MEEFEKDHSAVLKRLYFEYFGTEAEAQPLPKHASSRKYFLLKGTENKAIGVYGPNLLENQAFFHIQNALSSLGLPVPEIFKIDESGLYYVQSHNGSNDVFSYLESNTEPMDNLSKCVRVLVDMQKNTKKDFDFSLCYPHKKFDLNEVKREFSSFKNKYLLNKGINLDEDYFAEDIEIINSILSQIGEEDYCFMHRDFQARNLLINEQKNIVVIDFQGGREGPRHYDLASLLYSPESPDIYKHINQLIDLYRTIYQDQTDRNSFMKLFLTVSVVRLVHILGVCGALGLEQNNEFFKKNIKTAESYLISVLEKLKYDHQIEFKGLGLLYSSSL